jgi:hypothetical protein
MAITRAKDIDYLETRQFMEAATGEARELYFYKRKRMPTVALTGVRSEQLAGLALIEKDLRNAAKWYEQAKGLIPDKTIKEAGKYLYGRDREVLDHIKALFVASIIFYAKCFTQAEGRRAQLNRKMLPEIFRETHDFYMKYRHSFAAHSGAGKIEFARTVVALHPNKSKNMPPPFLFANRYQPDFILQEAGEPGFADLIREALAVTNKRFGDLAEKIMKEDILPKGSEFWYRQAKRQR